MLRLYDYLDSGNGYKVRLLLRLLGRPYQLVPMDILRGETRTPEFLAKNPNGRIPVLEFPDGRCLAESNAILFHLAEGTPLLPSDAFERALVLQWMCFEQYSHEPNIATVRFWKRHLTLDAGKQAQLASKVEQGYAALGVMQQHLAQRSCFVAERFSIADIALYAYTHVAHEGGFNLEQYPAVLAWLERCAARPGYVAMTEGTP